MNKLSSSRLNIDIPTRIMTYRHTEQKEPVWLSKLLPIAMSISIAASSWFLNQAWGKITTLETKIQQIEISQASYEGSKFTNSDWNLAKNVLDTNYNKLDLRVTRLEDNSIAIKESLLEIKQILKELR